MIKPNNVTRLLNAQKIPYQAFELPPEKHSAEETARLLQVDPTLVYKTIVVLREKPTAKPLLVVVHALQEVDLKAVAALIGEKKVQLPTERQAEQITGLQAGGISPLALLNRGFQVIMDESMLQHEQIHISGGMRGLNIRLPVKDLLKLVNARTGAVGKLTITP